jgi:hypothetical protein
VAGVETRRHNLFLGHLHILGKIIKKTRRNNLPHTICHTNLKTRILKICIGEAVLREQTILLGDIVLFAWALRTQFCFPIVTFCSSAQSAGTGDILGSRD